MSDSDRDDTTNIIHINSPQGDLAQTSATDVFIDRYLDEVRENASNNQLLNGLNDIEQNAIGSIYSDMITYTLHAFSAPGSEGAVPVNQTDDDFFFGLDRQTAIDFVKGFKSALEKFYAYSNMAFKNAKISYADIKAVPMAYLPPDLAQDISYELLRDALQVLSTMHELGFVPDPNLAGQCTPVIYFDPVIVQSVILHAANVGGVENPRLASEKASTVCQLIMEIPVNAINNLRRALKEDSEKRMQEADHPSKDDTPPSIGVVGDDGSVKIRSRFRGPRQSDEATSPEHDNSIGLVIPFKPKSE